jgi:hypothetical protein
MSRSLHGGAMISRNPRWNDFRNFSSHHSAKVVTLSLTPQVLQSTNSNSGTYVAHHALPAMAFLAALLSQYNSDNREAAQCVPDVSSFNFIADAAAIASPAVVNVVVNVCTKLYKILSWRFCFVIITSLLSCFLFLLCDIAFSWRSWGRWASIRLWLHY